MTTKKSKHLNFGWNFSVSDKEVIYPKFIFLNSIHQPFDKTQ